MKRLDGKVPHKYRQKGSAIIFVVLAIIVLSATAGFMLFEYKEPPSVKPTPMTYPQAGVESVAAIEPEVLPEVTVYKTETCGCCSKWVTHMEKAGFKVIAHDVNDLNAIKEKAGLTAGLASCHTALVDGYVVEGHVPASDVKRMLVQRPEILGLTAPGMPQASPGMQAEGLAPRGYDVIGFDKEGNTVVFNRY